MTAVFDPDAEKNNLEVTLHLELNDGKTKEMKATYTCGGEIDGKDLIIWPNFISPKWHRYFLYSELPHNINLKDYPFQATPFVGEEWEQTESSLHIVADSATADNPYKYEIYEFNRPFKGIRLQVPGGEESGYLLIRYTTTTEIPYIAQDKMGIQDNSLRGTTLGIDFGSTNTSIAYLDPLDQQAKGIQFTNRRISLLRAGEDNDDKAANENHLFFFQSNPLLSNAIKSTLTLHDSRRVAKIRMRARTFPSLRKK